MFKGDVSEPAEISRPLSLSYPEYEVDSINSQGYQDFIWDGKPCFCHGYTTYCYERKTWANIVSESEKVEDQLRRASQRMPDMHHGLILEGVTEPSPSSGVFVYQKMQGKNVFAAGLKDDRRINYKKSLSWVLEARKYLDVVWTTSMADTVCTLSVLYEHAQQPDGFNDTEDSHTIFRRYFKEMVWYPNPQVQRFLGSTLPGDNLAQVRVEAVIRRFGTSWRAWKAEPEDWGEIQGISTDTARKYLRSIGRGDIR